MSQNVSSEPSKPGPAEIRSTTFADSEFGRGHRWQGAGGHVLEFTQTGNLELRNPAGDLLWESQTDRRDGAKVVMKTTGELTVCEWRGYPIWSSGTTGHPGAYLLLQSDGNVVIYAADGTALWQTATAGK